MKCIEQHASFGGRLEVWTHISSTLSCEMRIGVYLPEPALQGKKCPVLYWLSGLTCTEQNFITKAGAQAHAARHGFIVVSPDTSPRGETVANDDAYDLGQGAGFYVLSEPGDHTVIQRYIDRHRGPTQGRSPFGSAIRGVQPRAVRNIRREPENTCRIQFDQVGVGGHVIAFARLSF